MGSESRDSPLRRSEFGTSRDGVPDMRVNDDDEERRQARRRTLLETPNSTGSSTFEENETLKKCLEIYNENKISRDNAWSYSLIDTLSALLDRHHKSLNNFKMAGSSLEASSKVYSLRVDSIHIDVLRLSAGLNAQSFTQRNITAANDDVEAEGEDGADPNTSGGGGTKSPDKTQKTKSKSKRPRKVVSTITRNKETLNARLDTVPLLDPVFGKLNSVIGSINSSNRLMNNILSSTHSELRLCTGFAYWDSHHLDLCDYTEAAAMSAEAVSAAEAEQANCDRLFAVKRLEELLLRPLHGGYVISDTPEAVADDRDESCTNQSMHSILGVEPLDAGTCQNVEELSMAFDINAECEAMPQLSQQPAVVDVDYEDFEDLTTEERTAINNCRGLRKATFLIEDLRPVNSSSDLEYSYRPLDKISQFWAGPSHWKFKHPRARQSRSHTLHSRQITASSSGRKSNQRGRRAQQLSAKRSKQLNFEDVHDDLFIKLEERSKVRKANFQKKWDQRKLKLPTDMQIDSELFQKYTFAPGMLVEEGLHSATVPDELSADTDEEPSIGAIPSDQNFAEEGEDGVSGGDILNLSAGSLNTPEIFDFEAPGTGVVDTNYNETVLEIATDFEGAPSQVAKIIVPFAKRAKIIDMKSLKRCCTHLLNAQIKNHTEESEIAKHPIAKDENYGEGVASFNKIYEQLPQQLTQSMAEALTPSVACYSVLHLANDLNLRLIPLEDLKDFQIRQVMD